ncbi:MAG: beta-galactosidase [Spirochaetes bacterium]|nr:beta-galactosidase [Spirochaetota bacterium]
MKKMDVTLKDNALCINNKPDFIYSGEIHYFRIKKKDWPDRIKKAKKANLNTISSYIPWRWHVPKENKFDFNGKTFPERDLISFLELMKKEKIYFIARIGPVSNGEMIEDGLPEWLFSSYPGIRLKNYAGRTNPYSSLIDYHHPDYHTQIQKWYSKLIPVLTDYLAVNGGPIILIQLDNEISMLNWLTKSPTYSFFSNSLFQKYLKEKYHDITNFNKAFRTQYSSFQEVKQPDGNFDPQKGDFIYEWTDYYREFYALYYKKLYSYMKEYSIDLPVIANIPQIYDYDVKGRGNMGIMTTSMFKNFGKHVPDVIFGGAYQYRRLDYENFTDITAMTEVVRMITPPENPMICAEMQTGIMFDRPVLYPSDVALNIKTSLATGLNGINGYMFAGGQNFENMGGFGNYHNWQAAIGADGSLADHYYAVKEAGEVIKASASLIARSKSVAEINIGLYLPYYQTEYLKGEFPEHLMSKRDQKFFDGLLRLIRLAGYNYRFIDLKAIDKKKIEKLDNLWVFSLEFMDKATQDKIADYSTMGRQLLFYPTVPEYDLSFKKCTILKDQLKIKKVIHKQVGANRVKKHKDDFLYYGGDELYAFETSTSKDMVPLYYSEDNKLTSFKIKRGQSSIIVCGFDLTHKFDFQIDFIESFAKECHIKKEIKNANRRVSTILRRGEEADLLFTANYTEMKQSAKINLLKKKFPVDLNLTLSGRTGYLFMVNYKLADDLTLSFVTAEIVKVSKDKKSIRIKLKSPGQDVELCYKGKAVLKTKEKFKLMKTTKDMKHYRITPASDYFEIQFDQK